MSGTGSPGVSPAERLHSRYRPEVEAERYIDALNPGNDTDWFILVEPGMGYLVEALRRKRPGCGVVVLHADAVFRGPGNLLSGVPAWYPDCGKTVQEFLESEIPEGARARIVEWRPSLALYGKRCLELVRESADFLKRAEAGRRTAAAFGGRWVRNFFRNLSVLRPLLAYETGSAPPIGLPVVVTGSGPGLEETLPEIRAAASGVFVLASSSSLAALAAGGVTPDMVIGTDGGGWALMHLYACFRPGTPPPRLACALTAALPSQCSRLPVFPIGDGSLWQGIALKAAGVPAAALPQRGTVTATALELALSLSAGSVFMAGTDLSVPDVRTHARPYGFDHLFFGAASRLNPVYSQAFVRSGAIRAGGSHDVYAAWFKSRLASWGGRVFSLGKKRGVFGNGVSLAPFAGAKNARRDRFAVIPAKGEAAQRCRRAVAALGDALGEPRLAERLIGELAPLLFPARSDVSPGELAAALRETAGRYLGAGRG